MKVRPQANRRTSLFIARAVLSLIDFRAEDFLMQNIRLLCRPKN